MHNAKKNEEQIKRKIAKSIIAVAHQQSQQLYLTVNFHDMRIVFFCIMICIGITSHIYAQEPKFKNAAMEHRYHRDKSFAESKRISFNQSTWIGAKLSDLIASWGKPTKTLTQKDGGTMILFERVSSFNAGEYVPGYQVVNAQRPNEVIATFDEIDTRISYTDYYATRVHADKNNIITKIDFVMDMKNNLKKDGF